jgi:hypothetical protein
MNRQVETDAQFDPDLPTASAVMASLCCVAAQYASRPSIELAKLALDLAYKLTAPQYAESKLITEVAKQLVRQWNQVLYKQIQARAVGMVISDNRSIN